jgi:hypothetical protein
MLFVIFTVVCLAIRKDVLLPTAIGSVVVGTIIKGNLAGGMMVAFNSIIAATTDLLNIIIVIALVVMMTKTMADMGSDRLMVAPLRKILGRPTPAFWVLGFAMLILSWMLWPTPAVALLGALAVPIAVAAGMPPLIAGMTLAIFGKGIGLSSDFIIQGTPAVTAGVMKVPVSTILSASIPAWLTVSVVAAVVAFIIAYRTIRKGDPGAKQLGNVTDTKLAAAHEKIEASPIGKVMAWVIPLSFLADIVVMQMYKIVGGDATALIGGTVLILSMISAVFQYKGKAFEKVMENSRAGWAFAVKVFGPVVIIAGFFWLGGPSLGEIIQNPQAQGLMFDWGNFIAAHVPVTKAMIAIIVTIAGILAAFDGSGYAAIPLGASIAMALGKPIGANVAVLASMAQMAAIWTGATLVPWGFLAVTAGMTGVDPQDLSRRNMLPTLLGLLAACIVTIFLA